MFFIIIYPSHKKEAISEINQLNYISEISLHSEFNTLIYLQLILNVSVFLHNSSLIKCNTASSTCGCLSFLEPIKQEIRNCSLQMILLATLIVNLCLNALFEFNYMYNNFSFPAI